jgi:hypothetical protein
MIVYVYFKFIVSDFPEVVSDLKRIQSQLMTEYTGLTCNLLKRPHPDEEGRETWMEVYDIGETDYSHFSSRLSELVSLGVLPHPRRNETFIPIGLA